ncbi:hypothetical protein GGH91_003134, partial [Coemansia sp. RSA 2671]
MATLLVFRIGRRPWPPFCLSQRRFPCGTSRSSLEGAWIGRTTRCKQARGSN